MAEDRERFDELLEDLKIKRAAGVTVMTTEAALVANTIGYPVLMRPSYVLGGQNMIIAFDDNDIREYMEIILRQEIENPILIDKYLMGIELEIDAICDGEENSIFVDHGTYRKDRNPFRRLHCRISGMEYQRRYHRKDLIISRSVWLSTRRPRLAYSI